MTKGPYPLFKFECDGCDYLYKDREEWKDDYYTNVSIDYFCEHPDFNCREFICRNGNVITPKWCPELKELSNFNCFKRILE